MRLSHRAAGLAAALAVTTAVIAACQPTTGTPGAGSAPVATTAEAPAGEAAADAPGPTPTTPASTAAETPTSAPGTATTGSSATTASAGSPAAAAAPAYGTFGHPFDATSHWNTRIGPGAVFVAPEAFPTSSGIDTVRVWQASAGDRVVDTWDMWGWAESRCQGNRPQEQAQWHDHVAQVQIPDGTIPDAIVDGTTYWTPNSKLSVVEPDGRGVRSFVGACRTDPTGDLWGYAMPRHPIDGDGLGGGCHGGSGLPCIGGVIRDHEVTGDEPIQHVVAINIGGDFMYFDRGAGDGFRWPASTDDGYAETGYRGGDPDLQMGSLLALPPGVDVAALGLTTDFGRKFARAAQEYGLLVADDSGLHVTDINVQDGAEAHLEAQCGGTDFWRCEAYQADLRTILGAVQIVVNHGPESVGGGG